MEIRISITDLRKRTAPSLKAEVIGFVKPGTYTYLSTTKADGFK